MKEGRVGSERSNGYTTGFGLAAKSYRVHTDTLMIFIYSLKNLGNCWQGHTVAYIPSHWNFFLEQNSIYYLGFNSYTNPKQHAFFLALDLFIYKTSKGLHWIQKSNAIEHISLCSKKFFRKKCYLEKSYWLPFNKKD